MKFETLSLHTGNEMDPHTGASSIPIYQASTFHQAAIDGHPEFDYGRSGNPTRQALEQMMATLEGGVAGFAFASGMAAITAVLLTLSAGDHVVACEDIYGGTFRALTRVFPRLGIETTFVDMTQLDRVAAAIRPNTRCLWIESPSNPNLRVVDLSALVALARTKDLLTVADNTFMSPYLQRPHALGVDVVVHSGTKFLGGHSDVIAGIVTVAREELIPEVYLIQNGFGGVLAPHDSWLLMRGIKTLAVRMKQSQATAAQIATYLTQHNGIRRVYYPGLPSHPGHALHMAQADGAGAVLSFELSGGREAVRQFAGRMKLPLFAVSLGAVETIVTYPATMSHAAMPMVEREMRGISDGLLRMSVGLEDADDLLTDLEQALRS